MRERKNKKKHLIVMPKPSVELNEFDLSGGSENSSLTSRNNFLSRNIEGNSTSVGSGGIPSSFTNSGSRGAGGGGGSGGGGGGNAGGRRESNDGGGGVGGNSNGSTGNCIGITGNNNRTGGNNTNNDGNNSRNTGGNGGNRDDNSSSGGNRNSKKYRHQNFSKNIYIGTKNAEKWDFTRQRLAFKNDVEFVTYLLKLADNDTERNSSLSHLSSTNSFGNFKLEPNLSAKNFGKTISENGDYMPPSSKTKPQKRVQFHDSLNNFIKSKVSNFNLKHNAQDKSISGNNNSNSIKNDNDQDNDDDDDDNDDEDDEDEEIGNDDDDQNLPEVLDCRIAEKIKNELEQKSSANGCDSYIDDINKGAICLKKPKKEFKPTAVFNRSDDEEDDNEEDDDVNNNDDDDDDDDEDNDEEDNDPNKQNFRIRDRSNQKKNTNVRKAPLNGKLNKDNYGDDNEGDDDDNDNDDDDDDREIDETKNDRVKSANILKNDNGDIEDEDENEIIDDKKFDEEKIRLVQSCRDCTLSHEYEDCPLRNPLESIKDGMDFDLWNEQKSQQESRDKMENNNEKLPTDHDDDEADDNEDDSSQDSETSSQIHQNSRPKSRQQKLSSSLPADDSAITFSDASLPQQFELRKTDASELVGIFTKIDIPKYTRLGPLIGDIVQINDIPDDCNMRNIFEIYYGNKSQFTSTENRNKSNWLRYIRPATNYDDRNANLVCIEKKIYFVTCKDIKNGCELLYWSDECNSAWQKKHTEKTSCGGCNMKFEHPLYYRTHCSVFHDPSFSLTIRKYHCKVCGEAVLGKENIMKHAAQMHDGKGAYQCQFCKKFFLRLNYLEMHRTYGCSANPQRSRPLCDFCGRKFCQPQKLKVHIKRMHSDMAEVLRDFQCKLCSKLLGSRAALQRHSKEVHSRNSTVVSCPRCQKLFQNRSNLKIHMLTHSGVRPFKCAESECTAAFTTKQCLQFHYKKVHNYTQEQMPKIERSVAYTFDAYSGGMKVDFLEQAPRRRRKSLEDQNSILSSSMLDSKSETDFSDDNIFESIKKSGKSIKDLCRNETNLSLLSSKITSIFNKESSGNFGNFSGNCNVGGSGSISSGAGKKRKKKYRANNANSNANINKNHISNEDDDSQDEQQQDHQQHLELAARRKHHQQQHQQQQQQQQHNAAQLSLVESFLSTQAQRLSTNLSQQQAASLLDDPKLHDDDLPHDATDNNFRHHGSNSKDSLNNTCQNLVVSKGSKKWISDDDNRHNLRGDSGHCGNNGNNNGNGGGGNDSLTVDDDDIAGAKILPNRADFIARFMMNNSVPDQNEIAAAAHEEDENSSFLDVVDSNNPGGHLSQFHDNNENQHQLHMNPLTHPQSFISTFYNNTNSRLTAGNSVSTSASMLVEAALNSVGNMMESDEGNSIKCPNSGGMDGDNNINAHIDVDTNRFGSGISNIDSLENEIKMMKNLNSFPMQIPPLPMFQNSANNLSSCNISPDTSTQNQSSGNTNTTNNNDIDVDSGSTPRGQQIGGGDSDGFSNHHQTPPSPQVISPGRDYAIFGGAGNGGDGPNGTANNMSSSSPLPSMQGRRVYPEHELISPASSPSIPRYDFSSEMCRKREQDDRSHNMNAQNQLSSDEENSIIAQNSTASAEELRMKFTPSQMDMMYSKYENVSNTGGLKYNNNQDLDVPDFRGNSANDLSDLQGLDMTSRANIGSSNYHHNFQLPSTTSANLGLGRYHHHIYDILSEREQQQQQQQPQQDHSNQLSMQHQQSLHNMLPDQLSDQDHDQTTSVDLSRTANYAVSSPPPIPYSHAHHDMLRMVSLDLTSNTNMGVGNNRSFLPSQMGHNTRDTLDHHRLLSTAEQHRILAASNPEQHRLLVDPTAHLLMEQNNRLLGSDQTRLLGETTQNRHGMVPTRGFGAYHQVASGNYHPSVRPVLPSPNHHTANPSNYHPFPAYY